MQRFFFDTSDNGRISRDDVGLELNDPEEARQQAIKALPGMAKDELPDGDQHDFGVEVRDGEGPLFTASLNLRTRWLR